MTLSYAIGNFRLTTLLRFVLLPSMSIANAPIEPKIEIKLSLVGLIGLACVKK